MADPPVTIRQLVSEGRRRLEAAGDETARLDAEVLLMHLLGIDRARLYVDAAAPVAPDVARAYNASIERRAAGEPAAYITGKREFMGLDFTVDRRVLVPRPETEFLVEWALDRMAAWTDERRSRVVVDVGTGSGAIAVSLARLAPASSNLLIVGSDASPDALAVAALNRERLAVGSVALVAGDLLRWCRPTIDLLLANLPYLRLDQEHSGLAFEPREALFSGKLGFDLYEELLSQASNLLAPDGALICEIDPAQRTLALEAAQRWFPEAHHEVRQDLAGLDRYLIIARG